MYQVALCDDERTELDKVQNMLEVYCKEHSGTDLLIERFESVRKLLSAVREEGYLPDLVLMDIYMPEKSGMEAARDLRDMGNESRILFLTSSKEHALEAFDVDAAQYLVKPIEQEKFFSVLNRLLSAIAKEREKYLLFRIDGRLRRVALRDIVFCEAQGKSQCLFLANGAQPMVHMTMKELSSMLAPYREFVRVGAAYIVNLGYIDSLNARELSLNTGRKIYLPRGTYQSLKKQYLQYYCEED